MVTCSAIYGAASFNNLDPMPSVPVALLMSIFERVRKTARISNRYNQVPHQWKPFSFQY